MQAYLFMSYFDAPRELGICFAANVDELFWTIDEFANPFEYFFCVAGNRDAMVRAVRTPKWNGDYCLLSGDDTEAKTAKASRVGLVISHSICDLGSKRRGGKRRWRKFVYDKEGHRIVRPVCLKAALATTPR